MSHTKNISKEFLIQSLKEELELQKDLFSDKFGYSKIKGIVLGDKILTIGNDTKLLSTTFELMLKEVIESFISKNSEFEAIYADVQNKYPDVTIKHKGTGTLWALDFKSTYRTSNDSVSGFTLGTYRGYFRDRHSLRNIMFPYKDYKAHLVLGIVYSENKHATPEGQVIDISRQDTISPVIKDIEFLVVEKYKIAGDVPGSGNTTNIGSVTNLERLKKGKGVFSEAGEQTFDHYWANYHRAQDEKDKGISSTYKSFGEYSQMTIDDYLRMVEK